MEALSSNRNTSALVRNRGSRVRLGGICMASVLLGLVLLGPTNLNAYPVVFFVQGTVGSIVFCSNPSVCDPLNLVGTEVSSGTYVSGITATGASGATCDITITGGGGTGATATVALSGTNTLTSGTALTMVTHGSGYTSPPTTGTVSNGTATNCAGTPVLTTNIVAPTSFTVSGAFDTSDTPISPPAACTAGTNSATYNVPSVTVTTGGISTGVVNVPITINVNSAPNPDTFCTSLKLPLFGGLTITATAGITNGTIHSTTPDGFGKVVFAAGTSPYTYGTVMSYVGPAGNLTEVTFTGNIDAAGVLHSFSGSSPDGGFPRSTLTQTGLKLGVASFAGTTYGSSPSLNSTLFSVTNNPTKVDTLVSSVQFSPSTQGTNSEGALFQASNGLLYGANATSGPDSTGTVFFNVPGTTSITVVDPSTGNPTVLPAPSSMIEPADGHLYGVTTSPTGTNVFFQITPPGNVAGSVKVLYTFTAGNGVPSGPVIQASDGNFYGETTGGATGFGQVYKLTKSGTTATFSTVYSFTNGTDGENPTGGLVQASNLLLYGVAAGGAHGMGVVFGLTLSGTPAVYPFSSSTGSNPSAGLTLANGNLYGITSGGGANRLGTVFEFNLTTNTIATVHSFSGPDGANPQVLGPAFTEGTDGRLYGTATASVVGGNPGAGTVYSLDLRLPRPVPRIIRFFPTSGPVGTVVLITGSNFEAVSSVTFNGKAAVFAGRGAHYISATVPTGATTGRIVVTTPNGVAVSATNFTVN